MNPARTSLPFRRLLLLAGALAVAWTLYLTFGHGLIRSLVEGTAPPYLNVLALSQRVIPAGEVPIEYVLVRADRTFLLFNVYLIGAAFLVSAFRKGKTRTAFLVILVAHTLYATVFIANTSFRLHGTRVFTLFDDAMISMRYARNLAAGAGLVWNPGQPAVEGFTNLLWTVLMALWQYLPIGTARMSLAVQVSGLALLTGSLILVKRIADRIAPYDSPASCLAVLFTAAYLPLNFWGLEGMETSLLSFLILLGILRAYRSLERRTVDPVLPVVLALGLLTRPDFPLPFLVIYGTLVLAIPEKRIRQVLAGGSTLLVVLGGLTLFRWITYHDVLPNTYYLKVAGIPMALRVGRGLQTAAEFGGTMSWIVLLLPLLYALLRFRDPKVSLLGGLVVVQILYSITVGGDAWEQWGHLANRYITIVMPCFFILLARTARYGVGWLIARRGLHRLAPRAWALDLIAAAALIFQVHGGLRSPRNGILMYELAASGIHVETDKRMAALGMRLRDVTAPDARLAVVWAGAVPYFSGRPCVDLLGKSDAHLAREPARVRSSADVYPGHNKYDYDYSIGTLHPDIVVQVWKARPEHIRALQAYEAFDLDAGEGPAASRWRIYVRRDSKKVDRRLLQAVSGRGE